MKDKIDKIFDALKYKYISEDTARKQVLDLFDVSGQVCQCRKDLNMPDRIFIENNEYKCKRCKQTLR